MPGAKHQTVVNSIELAIPFNFIYTQLLSLKNKTEVLKGEQSSFQNKVKPVLAYRHSSIILVLLAGI